MQRVLLVRATFLGTLSYAQICDDKTDNTTDPANPRPWHERDPTIYAFVNLKPDGSGGPKLDWLENA
jgi:hypothetical protein